MRVGASKSKRFPIGVELGGEVRNLTLDQARALRDALTAEIGKCEEGERILEELLDRLDRKFQ